MPKNTTGFPYRILEGKCEHVVRGERCDEPTNNDLCGIVLCRRHVALYKVTMRGHPPAYVAQLKET